MKEEGTRILLTGGHAATTGIATIEEIKKRLHDAKIFWIGSKTAISGSNTMTTEYKIYPSMGVKYFSITAGKLQTKFTRYTIPLLLKIPVGLIQALYLVLKIRPNVTLSFGGFSSFPVVFWSWLLRIPVILHEQTAVAGRASISESFFSRKIALGHGESRKFFPHNNIILTGNPLVSSILSVSPASNLKAPYSILVMGGSRGSEFINEEIIKIAPELTKKYKIVHITGERDFEKYKKLENDNYHVISFVDPRRMFEYYKKSDLIIARSGANTVSEIMYIKRPAILIPLPKTFLDEQVKNAKLAEEFGIAKVIEEKEVDSKFLLEMIDETFKNWNKITSNVNYKTSFDSDASQKLVDLLMEFI
jgi:UDP-N-acetylglucosamine--N-acetylmuramyl-(pentapeptide) pyrophosphoryl-undecaprenol N-acetylglucosamine transferase